MRVLIAEDEAYLNRILEKVLTKAGYAVDSCADGQEALEYLESTDAYDAAILDIMMPRVDGLTVLRRIRERGSDLQGRRRGRHCGKATRWPGGGDGRRREEQLQQGVEGGVAEEGGRAEGRPARRREVRIGERESGRRRARWGPMGGGAREMGIEEIWIEHVRPLLAARG